MPDCIPSSSTDNVLEKIDRILSSPNRPTLNDIRHAIKVMGGLEDNKKENILYHMEEHPEIVLKLLNTYPDFTFKEKRKAFTRAVVNGDHSVVKHLLQNPEIAESAAYESNSLICYAMTFGYFLVVDQLIQVESVYTLAQTENSYWYKVLTNPVLDMIKNDKIDEFELWFANNQVYSWDRDIAHSYALMLAVHHHAINVAERLVKMQDVINKLRSHHQYEILFTRFMNAVRHGDLITVHSLLRENACKLRSRASRLNNYALRLAANRYDLAMVNALLEIKEVRNNREGIQILLEELQARDCPESQSIRDTVQIALQPTLADEEKPYEVLENSWIKDLMNQARALELSVFLAILEYASAQPQLNSPNILHHFETKKGSKTPERSTHPKYIKRHMSI